MNTNWIKPLAILLGVTLSCTAIGFSVQWFLTYEAPWARILLLWAVTLAVLSFISRRTWLCLPFLYTAITLAAVGGFEGWMIYRSQSEQGTQAVPSYPMGYFGSPWPDILGYGPAANAAGISTSSFAGKEIYRVDYHYDGLAHRISPPLQATAPQTRILFFGCSFTLGEGVQDTQTTAWKVGELASPIPVQNWGFHGYGPHQMLSALENGLVRKSVPNQAPVFAIYQAIGDHVRRSAGMALYDNHGPRYQLDTTGQVQFKGHFDDDRLQAALRKSLLWRRITNTRLQTDSTDVALWGAIVEKAHQDVQALGPKSHFMVILWDSPHTKDNAAMQRELMRRNIDWLSVRDLIPAWDRDSTQLFIPGDTHPSAEAHQRLAKALWEQRVKPWTNSL